MRLGNITLAGIILLVLVFTIGMAGAAENATANVTANVTTNETSNVTGDANGTSTAASSDDEEDAEGRIGPGNALYGLKIAFENIDETFTFNESEKLGKQVAHARKRIAEARAELKKNNNAAADKALLQYTEKSKSAENTMSRLSDNDSGVYNAQQMIAKHELVLKNLLDSHPGNKGLERAYNNSQTLKVKFEEKIKRKEARKDGKETREAVEIKAKIIGNDTRVEVELKFKSANTDNFTIAQEIHDKFQLSVENINALLTVENVDKGDLKTELEAEASIEKGTTTVKAEYKFPINDTTGRAEIVSGIHDKLSGLTTAQILSVLEIKEKTEGKEINENKEVKKEENEVRKEEKRETQEARKENKGNRNED